MNKFSKAPRHSGNFRIIDLGVCSATVCPDFSISRPHRHVFAYCIGRATSEAVASISKTLKALGYSGDCFVEQIPFKNFERAYGFCL